jgi:pimeloyl-ACP methyl ester carboxylesterase
MYFVEYRGYGASTGEPSEAALYSDALKIYDTLSLENFESVSVIGRSLGSGVATYLASKRQLDAMVLITPYDSILNVAQQRYPIFPLSMLLKDKYESSDRAPELSLPTLVLIAPNDTVVPGAHTLNLIKSFRSNNVSQVTVPNTGHNSILNDPLYYSSIQEFILAHK